MNPEDMTSEDKGPVLYTTEQFLTMWRQAAGELRGFANALNKGNAGITAAQLRMAIQGCDHYVASLMVAQGQKPVELKHEPKSDRTYEARHQEG